MLSYAVFKEAWHKADLEPGSRHKYFESSKLVETARKFDQARSSITYMIPFALLRLQPLKHRRVIPYAASFHHNVIVLSLCSRCP